MKTAIIGYAGSGKSELFAALAPAAAGGGNRAMVKVPEPRLDPLVQLYGPRKVTYSEIEYLDIPGGGKGHGLSERVLNDIRPCDCLLAVLDAFTGANDPHAHWNGVEADLVVSDLAVVEKRLERLVLDKRKAKSLVDPKEEELLAQAQTQLEAGSPLRTTPVLAEAPQLRGYRFLSAKPILYAWNCAEPLLGEFQPPAAAAGMEHIVFAARLERELAELADPEERAMFLQDIGVNESVLDRVIASTYRLLGLVSFLTAGEKEVRAWPLRRGATAPEAAGVIHSDFQKGFIRAEVLGYEDFLAYGDFKKARERGLVRLEGKDYVVQDGDIIEFRFNV